MSDTAVQKFTFGDDFENERRSGTFRRASDRLALEQAEQRGYEAGFAAGQAAQQAGDEAALAQAFHLIAQRLTQFDHSVQDFLLRCEDEAVALAKALVELHGDCVAGFNPHAGFVHAARDVMGQFPNASSIIARVPHRVREAVQERLVQLSRELRFTGRIVVETLPDGADDADFAFEWPDGALRHDRAALRDALQKEFQHFGFSLTEMNNHG